MIKFPDLTTPKYLEISKYMKQNVDILKKELSDHIDSEIERFKIEIEKVKDDNSH